MSKFKEGDKVRVRSGSYFFEHETDNKFFTSIGARTGVIGVSDINGDDGDYYINLDGPGKSSSWVNQEFLSLLSDPEPVEAYSYDPGGEVVDANDVRKGDTIAAKDAENVWKVGVTGMYTQLKKDAVEIRLLHRPEPEVDPVQVKAMTIVLQNIPYESLKKMGVAYTDVDFRPLAKSVEAGVRAPVNDA